MLKTEIKRLKTVHDKIFDLGHDVLELNRTIYEALIDNNIAAIKSLETNKSKKIQKKADDIDNEVVSIISLYAPNAHDLRELIAFLKISNELVRVYTNTFSFIKIFPGAFSDDLNQKKIMKFVVPMQEKNLSSLEYAISMVDMEDPEAIEKAFKFVYTEENQTDQLYQLVEKEIMKLTNKNIELSIEYLEVLSAIRRIEKIADRALSVAYLMYYAKIGGDISRVS